MSSYYDSDDDYNDDYSYDAAEHMTNDPVHFQMYGYGGFGYDTSHIGPDEPRPELCINASRGDLGGVMDIVDRAGSISDEEKIKVINYARKWTEVDYRMSGFTKEWIWFDLTPLATSATLGHHEIVEYLLQQGADPTLRGYPKEKGTVDALEAAKQNLDYETRQGNTNGVKCNNAQRCVDLLTVANLYWDKASYSDPHYSTKARAVFSNRPNNYQLLQEALKNVPDISEYPEKKLQQADLECLKETSSPMLMCSGCNKRKHTSQSSSMCNECEDYLYHLTKECARKVQVEIARGERVTQQNSMSQKLLDIAFGGSYYDDCDDCDDYDYDDNYTPCSYLRPDGDIEGKDVQWCKDKGFFEVEEGLWSGKWYKKMELICRCCKESKHTALFSDIERMSLEFGVLPRCKVCARKEPSGLPFWDNNDDDNDEVTFVRPDGETETKDVQWCLDNGFFEVKKGLWSGNWYYETDLGKRKSLRKHRNAARFAINDMPPPPQSKKDTAAGSTLGLKNNYVLHSEPIEEPKSTSTKKVAAMKSTQSTPLSFTLGKSGSTDSNSDEKKITAPPFSFSLGKASADTMQNEDEKKANIYSFSFGEATVKPSFSVGSNEKKKKATIKTAPVSTSIQSSDEKKITASPFSFSFDKAASADTAMPNKGEKKANNASSFSFGEVTAKPSFSVGSNEKKKKATIKTAPLSTLIQSSDEKKIPFSFSFGKASADTIQDKGEKKANISSFSFGEVTAKPSFSVGSNRKKKKKKKKKATNKTAPVSTSIQFESTEQKDALHVSTPKSASRQTQNSPFSFGSVDTKTSSSTFCFGGTPQNTVDTPSRLGTTPSSTFLFDIAQSPKAVPNSVPLKLDSNSINLVSAESAISLLESLSPDELLPHHVERIKAILARTQAGGIGEKSGKSTVFEDGSLKRASTKTDDIGEVYFDSIRSAVFDDEYMLSTILHFEGSLAMSETKYNLIVGYESPKPFSIEDLFRVDGSYQPITFLRQSGTPSNALVCKKWKSFVIGEKGRETWKTILNERDNKLINLAKEVVNDESMPWSARILAMAIADDTRSLRQAFNNKEDYSQGIGAAFEEADHDDDEEFMSLRLLQVKCPRAHQFSRWCNIAQLFDEVVTMYCADTVHDWSSLFACNIAYAAAKVGSVGALSFLQEFYGTDLWSRWFGDKGSSFLGCLVAYSCRFPTLDGPVSSIRQLLLENDSSDDDTLHFRHRGCNGGHLHLAAARGHKSLVEVLLTGGMDPTKRCTQISPGRSTDPRDRCVREYPLAADWAEVRGHVEIAQLLRRHQSLVRPDLRSPSKHYQIGKLSTFFPVQSREYGFIEPGGIFVHLSQLRINSDDSDGYPSPGQKLCFTVTTDRRGRKRADHILDGSDFSYLRLRFRRWEAEIGWERYKWDGTEDYESYGSDY